MENSSPNEQIPTIEVGELSYYFLRLNKNIIRRISFKSLGYGCLRDRVTIQANEIKSKTCQ